MLEPRPAWLTLRLRLLRLLPCLPAAAVAAAVANRAYHSGIATELPKPHDLAGQAYAFMYSECGGAAE